MRNYPTLLDLQREIKDLVIQKGYQKCDYQDALVHTLIIDCDQSQIQRIASFADLLDSEKDKWTDFHELNTIHWLDESFTWRVKKGNLQSGRIGWDNINTDKKGMFRDTDDFLDQYLGKYLAANPEEAIKFKECLTPNLQKKYDLFQEFDMF